MRARSLLTLSILLAGCSSASTAPLTGRLAATTQRLVYRPGDSVVVRFANLGDQSLVYNACFASLSRRSDGGWTAITDASSLPCESFAKSLAPGVVDSTRFGLPANLPSGVYRYVFDSNNFTIMGGAPVAAADRETNAFQVS